MPTDPSDDKPVEFDWDRLTSWFAGLCRRERASDCLPAALWLVCSSDPPVSAGSGASASELEALRELVSELRDRFSRLVAGQPVPGATQSPGPLTWKTLAENLKGTLRAEPHHFRVYLWFTIAFIRQFGFRLELAGPPESEIRALLDYHDLYHPDLLPAVRRMTSSVPAATEVLRQWQPSEFSPQEKIVKKMVDFAIEALATVGENPRRLAALAEEVFPWAGRLVRTAKNLPQKVLVVDLPIATLHRVDQIMDDPSLSIGGKCTAILQVLTLGAQGKVVSH